MSHWVNQFVQNTDSFKNTTTVAVATWLCLEIFALAEHEKDKVTGNIVSKI